MAEKINESRTKRKDIDIYDLCIKMLEYLKDGRLYDASEISELFGLPVEQVNDILVHLEKMGFIETKVKITKFGLDIVELRTN